MTLEIDWPRLALVRRMDETRCWRELFALRCDCGRVTLGCAQHWFCGLCEPCRASLEDDEDDAA